MTRTDPSVIQIGRFKRLSAFLLAGFAAALRLWNLVTARKSAGNTTDIVVLEPFGLGDVLSHEPLLRLFREQGKRAALCARPEWRPLFPGVSWIDCYAAWGRHLPGEKYKLGAYANPAFRRFLAGLRTHCRGNVGIDTRGDIRNVILLYLAGCRRVITISHYLGANSRIPRFAAEVVDSPPHLRRWELNLRCAEPLGVSLSDATPPAFPHLRATTPPQSSRIGIMPTAPWAGKFWPQAKWVQVITNLQSRGLEVVALCGPGQAGLAREQLGLDLPILENDSVEQYAKNLQTCRWLLTLDSGPMHLADALGIPLVVLFGVGVLPLWAPSNPRSVIVTKRDSPEFHVALAAEENVELGRIAMNRIAPSDVLAAIESVLATNTNPRPTRPTVKLAMSLLCENPRRQTALTTFFREYLLHPLDAFPHLEWIVFAGPTQLADVEHPRLHWVRDYPANDQVSPRLMADHFKVGPHARRLGAAGLFTIGFAPLRATLPVFMGVNSLQFLTKENRVSFQRELYRDLITAHSMRKAALLITNSEFAASKLRTHFPFSAEKLFVSHEGTQLEYHPEPAPDEVVALKKELGLEPGYLFWASNFYRYKQAPLLLEAYADLPAEVRAKMPVVMVGGDWEGGKAAAEAVIRARGIEENVRMLGWIDFKWLPVLYRHAQAYVLPSREETFGRTTTEAMASGTPCLLHDIPIMHEIAGDAALIIDFNNRSLVIETLLRLHRDHVLRAQLRDAGLERSKKFSFKKMAVERVQAVLDWLEAHPR